MPPPIDKGYRTIVADPPWPYKRGLPQWRKDGIDNNANLPYDTLSLRQIERLVPPAGPDAHLYLWATSVFLRDAFTVAEAWGFKYSTLLVWCKPPRGFCGRATFSPVTEYVLFCRKGSLKAKQQVYRNWWEWPRGRHSQKPDAFYDMVEATSPMRRLEMFARRARFGWDYWGLESLGTAELGALDSATPRLSLVTGEAVVA